MFFGVLIIGQRMFTLALQMCKVWAKRYILGMFYEKTMARML